ncbi:quercetin 2,3-dioxygenase [Aspergillus eucalypticola CBS 122712]|uniref:Quercetin 2,3-dioxygenase n=1 Tax=Aspergillus eucalypticola (strain CBS 122712 / IBT 29274) TaxID=1448314 RepID=A0A317WK90_ASPEC|nr:quercetin 2,3-dioxygenase [Aspergillus eucalypticola CBS 122712]PWY85507.1 quercetin 2,3-dioxygenase [Aspergillus eucalypticola CBS 122712]
MRSLVLSSLLALSSALSVEDLYVSEAPSSPRPYILPHYENSHAVTIDSQLYRFTVTGPSSDYAFTLMSTNAPSSGSLGVLPHIHHTHYENFFNFKGRFQLWAQKGDGEQEARLLTQGDYGSVPRNTTHTFQILDPDTEMVGVIVPGGFEDLFYALGTNYTSGTETPYVPGSGNSSSSSATGPDSSTISSLQQYDVYAQLDFTPRRDFVNGTAPSDSGWHAESDTLGAAGKPYFIANNYGPKYLNSQYGAYQIVQPLVTATQAQDTNYTLSTIIMSRQPSNATAPTWTAGPAALEVLEGSVQVQIGEYETARVEMGDVVFVPKGVTYKYWNEGAQAKVLYVSSGADGVDSQLIKGGRTWEDPVWPKYF